MTAYKIELKELNRSHIPHFYKWWNDNELRRLTSGQFEPMPDEEIDKVLNEHISNPDRYDFILLADKKPIGHIAIFKPKKKTTFQIYIAIGEKDYWNRGIGTIAMKQALSWFFSYFPSEKEIELEVNIDNPRAIKCYEKVGFIKIKKKTYKKHPDTFLMKYKF